MTGDRKMFTTFENGKGSEKITFGEHLFFAGHVLSASTIEHPMFSTGLVVHLQNKNQVLLGTQICLGPWRLVTKALGTQIAFFLAPKIEVPTNLAMTLPSLVFLSI